MRPGLTNNFPTVADFYAKPDAVLRSLVIGATHRFVDDFVLRAIELLTPTRRSRETD